MRIVDFHTHAFPDSIAERAVKKLAAESPGVTPCLDGKVSSLLRSMDAAGIEKSVICSIATRPEQFEPIMKWSKQIASERIVPFLSFHPMAPNALDQIDRIAGEGFKGIKLHPYYQDFFIDAPDMMPFYERIAEKGLILVSHTGFDIAFPRIRKADPDRVLRVAQRFPSLKFVATHFGAWEDWDRVGTVLLGKSVYMEISFSLGLLEKDSARRLLTGHLADHILFGTDSPWQDQAQAVGYVDVMNLDAGLKASLLGGNALRLLA